MRSSFFIAIWTATARNPAHAFTLGCSHWLVVTNQNAHAFAPSCSNRLTLANQNARAFGLSSAVARMKMKTPTTLEAKFLVGCTALRAYRNGWGTSCEMLRPCLSFRALCSIVESTTRNNTRAHVEELFRNRQKRTWPWPNVLRASKPGLLRNRSLQSMPSRTSTTCPSSSQMKLHASFVNSGVASSVRAMSISDWYVLMPCWPWFNMLRLIWGGALTWTNCKNFSPPNVNPLPRQMVHFVVCTAPLAALGARFLFVSYQACPQGPSLLVGFGDNRTVFIPKSSEVWRPCHGRITCSLEALRPLSSCNGECEIITTAMCYGLRMCSIECIHLSQRCVTPLFQKRPGVLLPDFSCAYPSVDRRWMFLVLAGWRPAFSTAFSPWCSQDYYFCRA